MPPARTRTSATLARYSSAIRAACANERSCGSVRGAISNGRPYRDHRRAPREWLAALEPLGTDWRKPFLEIAPYLIVLFRLDYGLSQDAEGRETKIKHYYVMESVGIAAGLLLAALHLAGLATLIHTPSPMGFLNKILNRPKNEKPYLLIPVGYPAEGATVPRITKKPLSDVLEVVA